MAKIKIIFRADGNAKMGLGHVIRSLALADMLKDDFDCHFIIRDPLPTLKEQILDVCSSIKVLNNTNEDIEESKIICDTYLDGNEIVVLDGYHFRTQYQQNIKDKGCKVVCIDDIHDYLFVADVVINHAGGLTRADYSIADSTTLCLGLQYALLRKPFIKAAQLDSIDTRENSLFVCLGGADPKNDTLAILQKCELIDGINKIYVVLGGAYMYRDILTQYVARTKLNIEVLSNLDAATMVATMSKSAIAILPPSTISYEYLSVKGILYLKTIADNQKDIHKYFISERLAFDFEKEFGLLANDEKIKETLISQANIQKEYFDGNQKKRFLSIFNYLSLDFRLAENSDCRLYFDWANDPDTRRQSYNSDSIPYENHEPWFMKKVMEEHCLMLVITHNEQDIGQVRFDIKDSVATISYSLDANYRGKGLGALTLKKGVEAFKAIKSNDLQIIGYVKHENIASLKAFRKLKFKETKPENLEDSSKFIL